MGIGVDVGSGMGVGVDVGSGMGVGVDVGSGMGVGVAVDVGAGVGVGVDVGSGVSVGLEHPIKTTNTRKTADESSFNMNITSRLGLDDLRSEGQANLHEWGSPAQLWNRSHHPADEVGAGGLHLKPLHRPFDSPVVSA